jgi:hypothetical protein
MSNKEEGKKSRFSGLFGLDPTLGLGDKVIDHVEEAQEEERERLQKSDYYAFCPSCHKKQIKKNLLENGCFICGWKGTEEDLELAQAKRQSGTPSPGGRELEGGGGKNLGYKTKCPNCGASVVTEEFLHNGCWRCGWKEQ